MKFYKFTLTIMLALLIITASLSIWAVKKTFKISEAENNKYYSELAYQTINEYIRLQLSRFTGGLFSDEDFKNIWYILMNKSEEADVRQLVTPVIFDYHYFENHDDSVTTNMPEYMIESFLTNSHPSMNTQFYIKEHNNQIYIGVYKKVHLSNDDTKRYTYMVMTPIEKILDLSAFSQVIQTEAIEFYIGVPDNISENYKLLDDGGFLCWGHPEYNKIYMPITISDNEPYYIALQFPKPGVIATLQRQTSLIIILILLIFVVSSFGATYVLKKVSKQIDRTVSQIDCIAKGEYNATIKHSIFSEMQQLENSIYLMAGTIEEKIAILKQKNKEILDVLIYALDAKDSYTKGHSEGVAKIAVRLGEHIKYPNIDYLKQAALLHDIGKISIDEAILNKPEKLTPEEFNIMKQHPEVGYEILKHSSWFEEIKLLVLHHHERYDGKGYPNGLKGEEIPLGAQIIAIADVYNALTTKRPYRDKLTHEQALSIMTTEMQCYFSPYLLKNFTEVINLMYIEDFDQH